MCMVSVLPLNCYPCVTSIYSNWPFYSILGPEGKGMKKGDGHGKQNKKLNNVLSGISDLWHFHKIKVLD